MAKDFIENIDFDFEVSTITAFELVEHLFNPIGFIKKLNSLLCDNGIFILTTPNIEGFDLVVLNKSSDNIMAPNHLNYFNPGSIGLLCEKAGFEIAHIETPGVLDANIVKSRIRGGIRINDNFVSLLMGKEEQVLNNFQKFLQENNLSSNMLIVARKIPSRRTK